jgi:uncharacterized protein (TIGR02677 family)
MAAIGDVLALLRRVTEARRGGVSRESQLRHLAAWFAGSGSEPAAHALFDLVFGLGGPRHAGIQHGDPEAIATRQSWWDAPAVELSRTLVQSGRAPGQGNGRPARLERTDAARHRLRARQLAEESAHRDAAAGLEGLSTGPAEAGIVLDDAQTAVLRRLLDLALATRTAGRRDVPLGAAAFGVRLTLTPVPGRYTSVWTDGGRLHLDGYELTVAAADRSRVAVAA